MPVRKFRSVDAMEEPMWRQPGDPQLYRAIAHVWAFGRRIVPRRFPAGVHRHRSITDMDRLVEQWSIADFERLAAARRRESDRPTP
jgi:hypothetical protein